MAHQTYKVNLSKTERNTLLELLSGGIEKVRKLKRAQILLKADDGWTDPQIAEALNTSVTTAGRIRKRYVEEGLQATLTGKKRERIYEKKMDGRAEAHLIALVSGPAPKGRARWTLRLLAERLVALESIPFESISYETVRQTLKKTNLSLGERRNG